MVRLLSSLSPAPGPWLARSCLIRRHLPRSFPSNGRRAAFVATLLCTLAPSATARARLIVDHVVVEGKTSMPARLIAARMSLREGDAVDFEKLAAAEQRLKESDLFTAARVYIDLPRAEAARRMYVDDQDSRADVRVEVTEKTSWFIVPIASFGSGDAAAGVVYGDQNLLGQDVQLLVAAQIGQSRSFVLAGFRVPRLVAAPITWAVEALYRAEDIRFFASHHLVLEVPTLLGGADGQVGWVVTPHLRALVGFSGRYQLVRPGVVVDSAATPTPYNPGEGRIFLLMSQFSYDATSAPEGLRRGVRLLLKNEISDRYWGSEFDYLKVESRAELYGHFGWNYPSLVLDTVFDFPTSSRGVPITEMLRIGGATLRGYLVNEFHGDTLVSVQAEDQAVILRGVPLPLVDARFNVALAAFVDAAALLERHPGGTSVELPVQERPSLGDFHTSVGAGFRIILPGIAIPALKADLGYGIDVRSFAVTVSIGGAQ